MPFRFMQCFRAFNMFTVHKCSDKWLLWHLSKPAFLQSIILETNNLRGSSFVSKYCKFYVDSWNAEKNWENIFWFEDNIDWIGCFKHSLLLRENTSH